MSNFRRIEEIQRGFILFTKETDQTSFPAHSYATPGLCAKALYSKYVPLHDSGFDGNSPFCSQKSMQGTVENTRNELTYSKLETTKQEQQGVIPEQIGHGRESIAARELNDNPPTPYDVQKMHKVLEKMKHPVYDVEIVPNDEPLKKTVKRKKNTKSETKSSSKFYKWY
jgi:hypothetical protein